MGRALILFLPLLTLCFGAGFITGRAGKRKAISQATENIRPVVVAARNLATVNWLSDPASAALAREEALMAIDLYDHDQRKALI